MNTTADKLNHLTETKNAIKTAITAKGGTVNDAMPFREYANAIMGIPQEGGGGGSGIIDVTELPTENIDENAVYRVTESYKSAAANVWVVTPDEETGELTVQPIATLMGEDMQFNIIEVDNIEDMIPTDTSSENVVVTANILRTNGIAYLYNPVASSDPIPFGVALLETEGLDKGYTEDPYTETDIGIYTTTERYDTFQRWFIRESGEWKEITAYTRRTVVGDVNNIKVLSGVYAITDGIEITQSGVDVNVSDMLIDDKSVPSTIRVNTPSTGELIRGSVNEITEGYFRSSDGSYIDSIDTYAFYYKYIEKVELPEGISNINGYAFANCRFLQEIQIPKSVEVIRLDCFRDSGLRSVTFKGTPSLLDQNAFGGCSDLTTINVPWSEGEVENAPWGATNATINYNYTEG